MSCFNDIKVKKLNKEATGVHVEAKAHRLVGFMYLYIVNVDAKLSFKIIIICFLKLLLSCDLSESNYYTCKTIKQSVK